MADLDILSPKGQVSLRQEQEAIALFKNRYSDWSYVETPKGTPCAADGFLTANNIIRGVVETKCRDLTYKKLEDYNFEWLITMQKITDCIKIGETMHVPFYGFLYLVPDKTLLVKKIWDNKIGFVSDFNVIRSMTQATINGGKANRANAYIRMDDATVIRDEK